MFCEQLPKTLPEHRVIISHYNSCWNHYRLSLAAFSACCRVTSGTCGSNGSEVQFLTVITLCASDAPVSFRRSAPHISGNAREPEGYKRRPILRYCGTNPTPPKTGFWHPGHNGRT